MRIAILTAAVLMGVLAACRTGEAFDPPPANPGNGTLNDFSAAKPGGPANILGPEITK